ncbi:MAG: TlpA family protein disulfide reductase [Gammaproteobacteria bacterium]|nr:TlpA family protein disulfide reductase [Gammaproteobacteria bacterium]MBV9695389.1 TlpA family protein disulfide reductase [Gammaproteobacteria bacterium]
MTSRAVPAALLLVALCGGAGFLIARLTAPGPDLRPLPATARLPPPPEPAPPRRIPEHLPYLSLPDLAGTSHPLSEFAGHPLVVNFWATWCEPCRREIPLLEQARREGRESGLEVVGIALDSADNVAKYAKEAHLEYPIRVADRQAFEAASAFGMDAVLPFTVLADGRGNILTLKVGELRRGELSVLLKALLEVQAGRTSLAAARERLRRELPGANAALDRP